MLAMLAMVAMVPLCVMHMSAKEAVEAVATARDLGGNVFGETCPRYLYFSYEEHMSLPGFEGAKYVCSMPIRRRSEGHQAALWRYLRTNDLSVVATDHCPFCFKEQKELGIGGVEHRMDTIYQGVVHSELSLARWVELCSTTPARTFGLYPKKGVVAPGSDADIGVKTHHMNMDHSAYEGMVIDGKAKKLDTKDAAFKPITVTLVEGGQ